MNQISIRCLILACGNTMREDDGVGPFLAQWAEEHWRDDARVRVLCDHQWTPDMAEQIATAETVIFVDCSLDQAPGQIMLRELSPASLKPGLVTHHLGAAELLCVAQDLYRTQPRRACLLTIGAGSIELGEGLSPAVRDALPGAEDLLELTVHQLLG
ncbi:MAG: hydrogenase maturation protease [Terracidiphilus sp.]